MNPMDDADRRNYIAALRDTHDLDAIDTATRVIGLRYWEAGRVNLDRMTNPGAWPDHGNTDPASTARRAIADLLDLGWTPPTPNTGDAS